MKKLLCIALAVAMALTVLCCGCAARKESADLPEYAESLADIAGLELDEALEILGLTKEDVEYDAERIGYKVKKQCSYMGKAFDMFITLTQRESGVVLGLEYFAPVQENPDEVSDITIKIRDAFTEAYGEDSVYPTREMIREKNQTKSAREAEQVHLLDYDKDCLTEKLALPNSGVSLTWCITEDVHEILKRSAELADRRSICIRFSVVNEETADQRWMHIAFQLDAFALSMTQTP